MFRKILLLTTLVTLMVGAALLVPGGTSLALAQDETLPEATACRTCHEDLYYQHDSGKWYCLNETRVSCTECHAGNPNAAKKECAHEGLVASPIANDAAVCQGCHPDDYLSRVQTFAYVAGIRPTPRPYSTYTPPTIVPTSVESAGGSELLSGFLPGAWQEVGLFFLGTLVMILFLFSYRYWKTG